METSIPHFPGIWVSMIDYADGDERGADDRGRQAVIVIAR